MGTLMNALSILDRVRSVPSAAVSFLVIFGCAISRACGKRAEQSRSPYITFCEGLVPDAVPSFFGVANVEVPNNNPQDLQDNWPVESNAA